VNLKRSAAPAARPAPSRTPGPGRKAQPGGYQEALDELDRQVRQLRIDFERYWNGALPFPPDDLRGRIQNQLKALRNVSMRSAVESFRMGDLEARFNSYNELWNRRVRDREEGRSQNHPPVTVAARPKLFDPEAGIVVAERVEPEAAEALYAALARGPDGPKFDLASFRSYLERQTAALRGKTGCSAVLFRLAAEDGKLKLKARPVGA